MPINSDLQLSLILPIYDVEPYLEKCIRSLEDQDIPKESYEIICVNDGSPDNSLQIVKRLQKEFSNIVLINQENQGVSIARNNGIKLAKGEYLLFVDPDDFILKNTLRQKLVYISKNRLDVAVGAYTKLDITGKSLFHYKLDNFNEGIFLGIEFFNNFLKGRSEIKLPDRSWGIFLRREFIIDNSLFYIKDISYLEDGELIYRVYSVAKKVSFLKGSFYSITTRPGSATSSDLFQSEKARLGFLKAAKNLKAFQSNFEILSKEYEFLNQPIAKFLFLYLNPSNKYWLIDYFQNAKHIKNEFPKIEYKSSNSFYAKYAKYYNFSLLYFYLQYTFFLLNKSFQNKINKKTVIF